MIDSRDFKSSFLNYDILKLYNISFLFVIISVVAQLWKKVWQIFYFNQMGE